MHRDYVVISTEDVIPDSISQHSILFLFHCKIDKRGRCDGRREVGRVAYSPVRESSRDFLSRDISGLARRATTGPAATTLPNSFFFRNGETVPDLLEEVRE